MSVSPVPVSTLPTFVPVVFTKISLLVFSTTSINGQPSLETVSMRRRRC